jgi:hypothetical protein
MVKGIRRVGAIINEYSSNYTLFNFHFYGCKSLEEENASDDISSSPASDVALIACSRLSFDHNFRHPQTSFGKFQTEQSNNGSPRHSFKPLPSVLRSLATFQPFIRYFLVAVDTVKDLVCFIL